jgi:CHAT domain-containing protein
LTKKLPNEYWDVLAHLYKDEAALVKGESDVDTTAVRRLRLRASEIEARAGLDFPRDAGDPDSFGSGLLERTRRTLRPAEVFLGFHLGDADSCVWIVARQGFEFRRLPPRAFLAQSVSVFVKAVRENSPEVAALGNRLYNQLFGGVSRPLLDKATWIVAPDGPLFELPFAALVEGSKSRPDTPLYVVERHAIQFVPGIWALLRSAALDVKGPVVGLGDPIYNRADPRLLRRPSWRSESERPESRSPLGHLELARLAGSAREIKTYDKIWRYHGYDPILLSGANATRENLMSVLQRNPAVLHIAAHVLFPPQDSGPGVVALALKPGGEVELLTATEIAGMRLRLGLIVLNGCSSAQAAAPPGAGLMGMTRAWLAAGARAVIVTRWATSDQDSGDLFQPFYERLASVPSSQRGASFAQFLQQAQLAELRAGGRHANPAYWAAYFCVERN